MTGLFAYEVNGVDGQTKSSEPVIASTLLESYEKREPTPFEKNILRGEAQFLVVAGRSVYPFFLSPTMSTDWPLRRKVTPHPQP